MPRTARHFFWSTLETIHDWHGISIAGLSVQYLNNAFGFESAQQPSVDQCVAIGRDHPDRDRFPAELVVLSNPFIHAQLRTARTAQLSLLKPFARPEDDPFRLPLNAALTQHWLLGQQLPLHGALICVDDRGVLILGESHSGKSTLVQAALQLQAPVVSDDFLRIGFEHQWSIGHCLRGFLRFRSETGQRNVRLIASPYFRPTQRIDGVIFLESGVRPRQSVFSAITDLQATTLMVNQCAPFFLRREFPVERQVMLRLIGNLLQSVPKLSVATGFDLLANPGQFMSDLKSQLWADR